jgi:PEP-CTERM motif
MRRVVILALLALALPLAAWADTIDVTNKYGSINISLNGIVSTHSQMRSFNGSFASPRGSLGYVSFGTGAFSGSSLASDGTFSATGSWFDIVRGSGKHAVTIFSGAFVGPIDWTVTSAPGSHHLTFELTGDIKGMLSNGHVATGTTTQYFTTTGYQLGKGVAHITGGSTTLASTPEPGTLGLLGTGLVGIAGIFRRRKSA